MRILLIRHGETVHNVAGVYAGITDSALTNHGVLQAKRLGSHLSATNVKVTHIFSSDLQRAFKTAEAIREAQLPGPSETTRLALLREQDFGFYEGKQYSVRLLEGRKSGREAHLGAHRNEPGFQDVESKESMRLRAEAFVSQHLVELMHKLEDNHTVAVVAHGIILTYLWRAILARFHARGVSASPGVEGAGSGMGLEHLGGWSNTGYLDLEVRPNVTLGDDFSANATLAGSSHSETDPSNLSISDTDATDVPRSSTPTTSIDMPATTSQPPTAPGPVTSATSKDSHSTNPNILLLVKAVNSQEHLKGLKKTRGGIGSLKHDSSQKTVDSFFKKRRID